MGLGDHGRSGESAKDLNEKAQRGEENYELR